MINADFVFNDKVTPNLNEYKEYTVKLDVP